MYNLMKTREAIDEYLWNEFWKLKVGIQNFLKKGNNHIS